MTELLRRAIAEIERLPADAQDAIAARILADLADEQADEPRPGSQASIQRALNLAGAWKHIDDEGGPDMLDELDRMRHETKPTPLFEL